MHQFKDETPQEQSEGFDQSTAGDTEVEPNKDELKRAEVEFGKFNEELRGLDAKELQPLIDTLKKKIDEKEISEEDKQKFLAILWKIDQSEFINKLRKLWDRCPSLLQKVMYYGPDLGLTPLIKYLVRYGFLEVKGASEKDIQSKQESDLFIKKWAVRLASIFVPEVRPYAPLLAVFIKLEQKGIDIGKISRPYLAQKHAEEDRKENAKKHKEGQ